MTRLAASWLLYTLLTVLLWGAWALIPKWLGHLSAAQSQAFSTAGIIPILLVLAPLAKPNRAPGSRRGAVLAFAAGAIVGLGNVAYYHSLSLGTQASIAASVTALYPAATIVLAFAVLKETPRWTQAMGIVTSLAAIWLLNVGSGRDAASGWLLYALVPILLWGGAALLMKVSTQDAPAGLATFWFLAAFLPVTVVLLVLEPMKWDLTPRDWTWLALLGLTYGLGNLTVLAAYRAGGKASVVTPLCGLYPVITILLARAFFPEPIGNRQWLGIALALVAAAAMSYEPEAAGAGSLQEGGARGQ